MRKSGLKKGELAEERLRNYFLNLGYFVVRSVKAEYKGFDVTDVDLFLYLRQSPISRERTNVDVKMKQRPQALERVFWTKGLNAVLGLEKCIVATTDKRSHVGEFGAQNDVLVLDGNFMKKLDSSERFSKDRLNEEEFMASLSCATIGELGGDWKQRYESSKSNLLDRLNFDGLNNLLNNIKYHIEECCSGRSSEAGFRALYIYTSFFLVTLDYSIKDFSFKDQKERTTIISEGIRFGEMGKQRSEDIVNISSALVASFMNNEDYDADAIKSEILAQSKAIPSEDIAEYLGSTKMMNQLLKIASEFERNAFSRNLTSPLGTSTALQGVIGMLCDFYSMDRKQVLI